nr:BspA family leucine-rich repeat surface protein [uncultured Allomuricauda sp.]
MKKILTSILLGLVHFLVSAQTEFITTWKTDNPGVSADNQITIPTFTGETYNYTVDWGDGTSDSNVSGDITHTYGVPGTYQVSISGTFPRIYFEAEVVSGGSGFSVNGLDDNNKLLSIDQWGSNQWTSMRNAFFGCENMVINATDIPDFSNTNNLSSMFRFCSSLSTNEAMRNWDVSSITSFYSMFEYAILFNEDIGGWDTSNVGGMGFMFSGAESFNQDIGGWDTSNLRDAQYMFQTASAFNQDVSSWNLENLIFMNGMFSGASSFNQPIGSWNVSNVTVMANVFSGATSFNQPIGEWDVSNVESMNSLFDQAMSFNQDLSAWDMSNVVDLGNMFQFAQAFDQNLGDWDIGKVTSMSNMFSFTKLSQGNYDSTLIGWSNLPSLQSGVQFDAGRSTFCSSDMARTLLITDYGWTITDEGKGCPFVTTWKTDNPGASASNQISIPVSNEFLYDYEIDWGDGTVDTDVVAGVTHTYATAGTYQVSISGNFPRIYFNESGDAAKLLNIKKWGDIEWASMESAFAGCSNLAVGAADAPNLSNVTSLNRMFYNCNYTFNNANAREFPNFNGVENFDSWDVSTITDMSHMFDKSSFNQDIPSWDVSNVEDMSYMFFSSSFDKDINSWDVSNVVNMAGLFSSGMFNQNISDWDVSSVVNIDFIFNSTYFNHDITGWNVVNLVSMRHAFSQGHFDQDLSLWDITNVLDMSNAFDDSDLSKENYDNILIAWSQLPGLKTGVVLGANDAVYCAAENERATLINDYGWTINDYGIDCETEVPFVTTWKTDNPGPSNDNQITIPTSATDIYDYRVDWGDGTFDEGVTGDITHTYAQPGVYEVSITGKFPRIYFNGYEFGSQTSDDLKLLSVDQWGSNRWKSMDFAFAGCENMDITATDIPDFSRGVSLTGMFWDAKSLEGNASIANWDIEKATYMNFMFRGASSFNGSIGEWDVTGKRDFTGMFEDAESFDQDLSNWNVQDMENMTNLFKGSGLSNTNYDKILMGWSQLPSLKNGVQLGAPDNYYCSAADERQYLIDTYGWSINDAGANEACFFVTTWKTDNPGMSQDNQITIPTSTDVIYDYSVDWGDGNSDSNVTGDITHTYSTPGVYEVSISGTFPQIFFVNQGDKEKILSVNQWGDNAWYSMFNAFHGCSNLDVVAEDTPNLSNVTNTQYMFRLCGELVGTALFNDWDLSSVISMDFMFREATNFNQDISNWDVGSAVTMMGMFLDAKAFNQNIGTWDIQNVTTTERMFRGAESFNQNLNTWNTSNVVNMYGMFFYASAFNGQIGAWNVGNVANMSNMFTEARAFNQDISNWNTSSVTEMASMFGLATSFNQDLNGWNVSNVTNMAYMFENAESFNGNLSNWNVSSIQQMANMFNGALSFNQDISSWDVSNVVEMSGMLAGASTFDQDLGGWNVSNVADMTSMLYGVTLSTANYDSLLTGWSSLPTLQTGVVFDAGNSQFCSASSERQLLIDSYGWTITDDGNTDGCYFVTTWKTDNPGISADNQITIPTHLDETYSYTVDWGDGNSDTNVTGDITHTYATAGTYQVSISGDFPRIYFNDFDGTEKDSDKLLSVDQWGTGRWSSMDNAFTNCSNMDVLATDIPDLSQVTSLGAMFRFCQSLEGNDSFSNWDVGNVTNFSNLFDGASKFNQPIGTWDVSQATWMVYMFSDATDFNSDISNWNLSNVNQIGAMFLGASSFNQYVGSWDTHNVVSMSTMFAGASAFNQDISTWDVSNVESMGGMFSGAKSFNQDISKWNVGNVTNMNSMFAGAESFNQPIGVWDVSAVTDMSAMFFEATLFNQPLYSWNTSNVTKMSSMFGKASTFNQPLGDWDVSNVESTSGMFLEAVSFNQDLSNWDMGNKTSIGGMFNGATSFDQNLGEWEISNVTNMDYLFLNAGLSLDNYDKTLIGWNSLTLKQNNVVLNAGSSQYCDSEEARQSLIDGFGWTIVDGGKAPLCNEDNDADGVLDHLDLCLDTRPDAVVDEYGCEIIPVDAIQVYVLTPSCIGSSDGAVTILMSTTGHLMDISIIGDSYTNQFDDVVSGQEFEIGNLSEGTYTITVSIPEILFEQTYGVTVNELASVTGKRASADSKTGTVIYEVAGSENYNVQVNGEIRNYTFENTSEQTIVLNNLHGQTEIAISGENDCQGIVSDSFFIGDTIQVYPTITSASVNILSNDDTFNVQVFGIDGRLVKEFQYNHNDKIMDVSTLKSGVYLLQMEINGRMETVKIVKR